MKLSTLDRFLLVLLLAGAFVMRVAVIGWGLLPPIPEVIGSGIRSSYAIDEDDILSPISQTKPEQLDFDPRQYHWGALHLELTLIAVELAEHLGYLDRPWRRAFYEMLPGDFERVFVAARLVSVLAGIASIALMFFLAREYVATPSAFWAAALVALSPAHLLASTQIRVDITMTALVILAAWLGVRAQRNPTPPTFLLLGLAAGASICAKYSAVFLLAPLIAAALWGCRFALSQTVFAMGGVIAGFVLAGPYLLVRPVEITQQVLDGVRHS